MPTSSATVELFKRLRQTMVALKQSGIVSQRESLPWRHMKVTCGTFEIDFVNHSLT